MNFEESLERVYRQLLNDALIHTGPGTTDRAKRHAFARVAHFVLRSLPPREDVISDVLRAATAATDHPDVLNSLACGVWSIAENDSSVLGWFTKLASHALERGHLVGFCGALNLLVHLPGFGPTCSDAWLAGIRAARDDHGAQKEVFWVGYYWQDRFYSEGGSPAWLVELRQDERVLAAAAVVEGERVALSCPACGKAFSP